MPTADDRSSGDMQLGSNFMARSACRPARHGANEQAGPTVDRRSPGGSAQVRHAIPAAASEALISPNVKTSCLRRAIVP